MSDLLKRVLAGPYPPVPSPPPPPKTVPDEEPKNQSHDELVKTLHSFSRRLRLIERHLGIACFYSVVKDGTWYWCAKERGHEGSCEPGEHKSAEEL